MCFCYTCVNCEFLQSLSIGQTWVGFCGGVPDSLTTPIKFQIIAQQTRAFQREVCQYILTLKNLFFCSFILRSSCAPLVETLQF